MNHLKSADLVDTKFGRGREHPLTDKRQLSGRLAPVFPSLLQATKKEEEYVARMVARDRELGWG